MPSIGTDQLLIQIENGVGCDFGYIVIDSILNNTSSGGVRITGDISLEEIKAMAAEMTLKYNFIGLNRGGAKSGIKIPEKTPKEDRKKLLAEFGRRAGPIIRAGIYYPGRDMNCSEEDLSLIYKGAGCFIGKVTDTSFFTAVSLEKSVTACKEVYGLKDPVKVAIEGFGSVGGFLAERLNPEVFHIIGVSTKNGAIYRQEGLPLNQLLEYKKEYGDDFVLRFKDAERIEKKAILNLDVDILIPCARTWAINEDNVGEIKSRLIIPGANVPYTDGVLEVLQEKGAICLPGFVCNSGGVYGSSMFDRGINLKNIERFSEIYFKRVIKALLNKSKESHISPVNLAIMIAKMRFKRQKIKCENPAIHEKIMNRSLTKRLSPKPVLRALWMNGFRANLEELEEEIMGFQANENDRRGISNE
ncbi:MAG: Glu/Leu/Phe/Val dehydrogenase dimerization domain-containing protein [bacterium]